jgi:hypothetical protein
MGSSRNSTVNALFTVATVFFLLAAFINLYEAALLASGLVVFLAGLVVALRSGTYRLTSVIVYGLVALGVVALAYFY